MSINHNEKAVWRVFSKFIRARDANWQGYCQCISCSTQKNWKEMDAGHYISVGSDRALKYNEFNVNAQCLTKHSKLRMFNGIYKNINLLNAGDKLWGFNEKTFEKEVSYVLRVIKFVPEQLYEIELENKHKFYATGNHEIVANKKWIKICKMLRNCSVYDIMEM